MRLFRFRGGIHPDERKEPTADGAIEKIPLPERLYVPLQQHIGAPAKCLVEPGQKVLKGELIGAANGVISAPVHAPTSGTVITVGQVTAPHPSGLPIESVVIEPDGEDRWFDKVVPIDPFTLPPAEVAKRVGEAGIVGMGGAAFPAAVKLDLGNKRRVRTLIINGGECEPYLTADDRLMRERAEQTVDGIRIMLHAIECGRAIVAIEDNKPEAFEAMTKAAEPYGKIEVTQVPTRYPMGSEKQMIQTLTGREVPAGKLAADIGIIVHNVATAYAVHDAIRYNHPLVARIVTVSGGSIANPKNLEVPLGTLASDLINYCGGFSSEPVRLLMGGPMMGMALQETAVPIVKGSNGVLAMSADEVKEAQPRPCIRCARCVGVCPLGLMPLDMAARARAGDLDGAAKVGLGDCISCGTCAYVCPAGIPLTQYFNYAKGELAARRAAEAKTDYTRTLVQARTARIEAQELAKKEAAARRKAEREAKKKAEAEAAAAAEESVS